MNPSHARRFEPSQRGFALIVTLSLMILLTIIAVGLLTLSSISLRASSQGEAAAVARANARLALMMAIGELQRELGPDSRITAPYDAGTTPPGGKPRWTAVYDAWSRNADANTPEDPKSRIPKFRGWLASGANQATGGPAGTSEEAQLVGPGSLGTAAKPEDQIRVPMHAITRGNQQGRIAWWTSDESVKAKINAGPEDGSLVSNPLFDAQSPPHVGHKAVPDLRGFDWKPGQRSIAITNGGVNLAAKLGNRGVGSVNHDITVHSAGVLADVRAGHLRRDLSNLLARPIAELENKPLYAADGRVNRFKITEDGQVSNAADWPANTSGADRWGINLEELHLFHQLHREIDWSSGQPRLVSKNSKEELVKDPFYIYRHPVIEALQIVLSFTAIPDTAPGTYKIQGMLDAMVSVSNPNDIPFVWPASLNLSMEMHSIPYRIDWDIRRANGAVRIGHTTGAMNRPFFQSNIKNGFTLLPGEAAVFGSSLVDTQARQSNLTRGFVPRGGVRINDGDWGSGTNVGLGAVGLAPNDVVDFSMLTAPSNFGAVASGWILCPIEVSNSSSSATEISLGSLKLDGGGTSTLNTAPINKYMLNQIRPPQKLAVQEFIGKPMPVMMITLMPNTEKSRALLPPNAFPSRPFQLRETAIPRGVIDAETAQKTDLTMHNSQWIVIAEPMDYKFGNERTLAAGEGGRNLYHGAAREVALGGSFTVIKRRIPLAPPLSIGAFENAVACGLSQRFSTGSALDGNGPALPAIAKAIGNSWTNPFLASNSVYADAYHDPSWMANTALWDSWFLSGIVDGGTAASSSWVKDSRSPRQQFRQLAENSGSPRNRRLSYHPHKSTEEALNELFNGEVFKPSAINKLAKYLLVDGAFNVNSTSLAAWKAFLTSVREQSLLDATGAPQKKTNPFGTLGYAVSSATSGREADWNGFRDLTNSQVDALAAAIVEEVKSRGPFLNMADFVNRRPNSSVADQKALGALQAAIDKSGLNDRFKDPDRDLTPAEIPSLDGKDTLTAEPSPARAISCAGFLSQAALLTAFGPQITVRGDTFVIRTYGDSRDPSGKILAKAWCEAAVQRVPEFIDPGNSPEAHDGWPQANDKLSPANSRFGRRLTLKSFRWLASQEI